MEVNLNPEAAQTKTDAVVLSNASINIPVAIREQISAKIVELKAKHNVKKVFVVIVEGDVDAGRNRTTSAICVARI